MKTPKEIAWEEAKRGLISELVERARITGADLHPCYHERRVTWETMAELEKWRWERDHPEFDSPKESAVRRVLERHEIAREYARSQEAIAKEFYTIEPEPKV